METLIGYVQNLLSSSAWATIVALSAFLASVGAATRVPTFALGLLNSRRARNLNRKLTAATHVASFTDQEIAEAIQKYVEPDCSQTDPSNEADLRQVAAVRGSVFATISDFIGKGGASRHLLVLADSGMGKTTLCLNFYRRFSKKWNIAVVPLGRADAVTQIVQIEAKRDTILFLDALDEDTVALEDFEARIQQLMHEASTFKAVIITCRSQFFLNDAAIPSDTGIAYVGPRKAGESRSYKFYKLYLLPFTERQVNKFINLHVPFYRQVRRAKARRVVDEIPEMSVRPMLLALIPDLVRSKTHISELYELYDFMVRKWFERESSWIDPATLLTFSKRVAVNIYLARDIRHNERISFAELREVAADIAEDIRKRHLTSRSLLNRDSEGNFKFAHRSVMEYFFVKAFIDGEERCRDIPWTDLMKSLFISWGRSASHGDAVQRGNEILQTDLRKTELLPLLHPVRAPRPVLSAEQLSGTKHVRAQNLPAEWRLGTTRVELKNQVTYAFDFAYDLSWEIVDTSEMPSLEEKKIFRRQMTELDDVLRTYVSDDESYLDRNRRLPSIDEIVSLWELETISNKNIFDRFEFYWLGDRLGKGTYLAFSLGAVHSNELLTPLTSRVLSTAEKKEMLYIYEVASRTGRGANGFLFAAQACLVTAGGAENSWFTKFNASRHEAQTVFA